MFLNGIASVQIAWRYSGRLPAYLVARACSQLTAPARLPLALKGGTAGRVFGRRVGRLRTRFGAAAVVVVAGIVAAASTQQVEFLLVYSTTSCRSGTASQSALKPQNSPPS